MKRVLVISVGVMMLLSSCGTYTESGATTGGWFGSVIGSAIGGIAGGPRGSDIGTLVGMAGGAMVGAAVGAAADQAEQQKYEDYKNARQRTHQQRTAQWQYEDDSRYGYDRDASGYNELNFGGDYLEIRYARILDASRDGILTRGEEARMVFEIYNNSAKPVYGVQPSVMEVTGNRHIHISENILIESIPAGKGVRYTASIKADKGLKDGEAVIRIGVLQGNKEIRSQSREFPVRTSKR